MSGRDVMTVDCSSSINTGITEIVIGTITRYIISRVGLKGNVFTVSQIVIKGVAGYHQYSVSLKAGLKLYQYINSDGRSQRMDDVRFYLIVISYRQCVLEYTAIDSGEWIGDKN